MLISYHNPIIVCLCLLVHVEPRVHCVEDVVEICERIADAATH